MKIEVHSGNQIKASQDLISHVEEVAESALARFSERITRVIIHFGDENSAAKAGSNDKRCSIEVRYAHVEPIAVHNNAGTIENALQGAMDKVVKILDKTLDRRETGRETAKVPAIPELEDEQAV